MNIRPDLQAVSHLLYRLVEYAKVFDFNNRDQWPHLKNNEDFRRVYQFPWPQRGPMEEIYGDGRDLAVFMSSRLIEFNSAASFPTLKSFVDSFSGGWMYQTDSLEETSKSAKNIVAELEQSPWAVTQMIKLFDEQIKLLAAAKQTIDALKQTDIYKWECNVTKNIIHITEYERILGCIHAIGKMFERLPNTYSGKDEEHLRDHILVTLGAAIIGSTTGETFNKRGKTDILVRGVDANEFIGECKYWRGSEGYQNTISQLLSYLSWRDNKAAIILFVPNREFTSIMEKIKTSTPKHPNFLRFISEQDETWINYELKMNEDPDRTVRVAVMAYHVPPIA
jgi:hypothetical protein